MKTFLFLIIAIASLLWNFIDWSFSLSFVLACAISAINIPAVIRMVNKHNLMDKPDERKRHKAPVPTMGGIGVYVGMLASSILMIAFSFDIEILSILLAVSILFFSGIKDDISDLSPKTKFGLQFIAAILVCTLGDIRLESLHGILGYDDLSLPMQYVFSIFLIVGITNAFNLIDGIDGLAGGIAMINALIMGFLLWEFRAMNYAILAFTLAGALLGFLYYNFSPAKIFMGDTGSLFIGFLLAILGMKTVTSGFEAHNPIMNGNQLVLVFGILLLPVFDTLRLFISRILKKRSPFSADNGHVHHLLLDIGLNHKKATITLYIINIALILFAFFLGYKNININISLVALFSVAMALFEFFSIKRIMEFRLRINSNFSKLKRITDENNLLTKMEEL